MHPSCAKRFLHTALLMVVLCAAGHVHNHVCLDGQEVASELHFENLGGHPEHEDDATHADVENELMPQVLLTKTLNQDGPLFFTVAALVITEVVVPQRPHYGVADERAVYHPPVDLLPPSQGPPSLSA